MVLDSRLKRIKLLNVWRATLDAVLGRCRVKALPLNLHLEVNDYCNLHCFMCPREGEDAPRNTGNVSLDVVHALGPLMQHALHVGLVGNGEPFLHPQLFEIIDYIIAQGSAPTIITNGTLMKAQYIEDLVRVGPLLLLFSIDGATKETFERIREGADFDKVVENMLALAEKKRILGAAHPILGFVVTLMKENLHELNEIVALGARAGVSTIIVQKLLPHLERMRPSVIDDHALIRRAIAKAEQQAAAQNIELRYLGMGQPSVALEQLDDAGQPSSAKSRRRPPRLYCENIWQQLHIKQNGDAQVCCFWRQKEHGNVLTEGVEGLWNGEAMRETRRAVLLGSPPVDCQTCHVLERHDRRELLRRGLRKMKELWRQ